MTTRQRIRQTGPKFSEASVLGVTAVYRSFPTVSGSEYEEKYQLTDDEVDNIVSFLEALSCDSESYNR
ncbi:hypothetical protein [Pontibacterium sp.]|uniref:hypothetical protein n=1 Tax=Pontibacterium sp. TaxID=2036026 RepID=UPI003562D10B